MTEQGKHKTGIRWLRLSASQLLICLWYTMNSKNDWYNSINKQQEAKKSPPQPLTANDGEQYEVYSHRIKRSMLPEPKFV